MTAFNFNALWVAAFVSVLAAAELAECPAGQRPIFGHNRVVPADALRFSIHQGDSLFALNASNGHSVWGVSSVQYGPFVGGAAYDDATNSVVVCTKTTILILDAHTGATRHVTLLPSDSGVPCSSGAPLVYTVAPLGPVAVVGTTHGLIITIDVATGVVAHMADLGQEDGIEASPLLWSTEGLSMVVVGTNSGRLFMLDAITGTLTGAVYATPDVPAAIPNGHVSGIRAGMLLVGNTIFFTTCTATDNFHAVTLTTMSRAWVRTVSSGSIDCMAPALVDDKIVVTTSDGSMVQVAQVTGVRHAGTKVATNGSTSNFAKHNFPGDHPLPHACAWR